MLDRDRLIAFALGPDVPVPVEPHLAASRQGEAVVVYAPLDAESYRVYDRLTSGTDGRSGDPELATRYLAAARFRRIDGLRYPSDVARYASVDEWFACSDAGLLLAEATVREYVRLSTPDQSELERIELATFAYLERQDDKDPYRVSTHVTTCSREIWEDVEDDDLVALAELDGRGCSACLWERAYWAEVLKKTGQARYGRIARRMLELGAYLDRFETEPRAVTAREWIYAQTVSGEVDRYEKQKLWLDRQKMKENAS